MSSPVQDLSVLHQRREQRLMLALALPALLVILLLVVLPVGWLAWQSVYHNGFTLENYRRIWSEDIYWRSFALTFQISLLVTRAGAAARLSHRLCGERRAKEVGHHHPGAGGAAVLDQRAGPRLCLARAVAADRRHQPAAAPARRDRRAAGAGPQQLSAPSLRPCTSCCRSWCCRSTPPCSRSRAI